MDKIVIDNGTGFCKAGFAGEEFPCSVFPTVIGRQKLSSSISFNTSQSSFIGDQAISKKGILDFTYPIERGVITHWDDMEAIWHHIFNDELKVSSEEHKVLITDVPLNSSTNREKITQIMFETFGVQGLYIAQQATMALYSTGKTTGFVLDSGDGVSHTVPVFEGFVSPHSISRIDFAGRDLTKYLMKILKESGTNLENDYETVNDIKETMCKVALDFDDVLKDSSSFDNIQYELPDGNSITIGNERFKCPEALFQPSLIDNESDGIHKTISDGIKNYDPNYRKDMYFNIVIAGGSTMFEGFLERMQKELTTLSPKSMPIKITALPKRKLGAWIGGSMLGSLSTFTPQDLWIMAGEYEEVGRTIVHRKCFH